MGKKEIISKKSEIKKDSAAKTISKKKTSKTAIRANTPGDLNVPKLRKFEFSGRQKSKDFLATSNKLSALADSKI